MTVLQTGNIKGQGARIRVLVMSDWYLQGS